MKAVIGPYRKSGDRKVEVDITSDDVWDLMTTLAYIIIPSLKEYMSQLSGYPGSLKSEEEWLAIIRKMIWSFEEVLNETHKPDPKFANKDAPFQEWYMEEEDKQSYAKQIEDYNKEVQSGLDLFAKYYRNLWY